MGSKLISKVFLWMTLGLLITFVTGYCVSLNEKMLISIFENDLYWLFLVAEFVLVLVLSARVMKMKPLTAKICFMLYSLVSGITFSSIFIAYNITSILYVFIIAAVVFAIFGAIGYFTNIDLTKLGSILFMALVAIIICLVINIFVASEKFDIVLTIISIIVFMGFTAYDVQKIKKLEYSNIPEENLAIYGALELYLDYINIFFDLLRLFGNSDD